MTSFVGQRQETADVKDALAASRLVTLTGTGVGKSRLARHVAAEVRRSFAEGVCLVDLTTVREPSLVVTEVTVALGLWERARRAPEPCRPCRCRALATGTFRAATKPWCCSKNGWL